MINDSFLKNIVINFDIAKKWGKSVNRLYKSAPQPSVLASGKWIRFEVTDEGLYKIDYTSLTNLGFTPGSIDPRTIKIYNNGGYQLPEGIYKTRPVDLVENAIFVSGESDGTFNTDDYILFYGRGVDFWEPKTYKEQVTGGYDSITVTKVVRVKKRVYKEELLLDYIRRQYRQKNGNEKSGYI